MERARRWDLNPIAAPEFLAETTHLQTADPALPLLNRCPYYPIEVKPIGIAHQTGEPREWRSLVPLIFRARSPLFQQFVNLPDKINELLMVVLFGSFFAQFS